MTHLQSNLAMVVCRSRDLCFCVRLDVFGPGPKGNSDVSGYRCGEFGYTAANSWGDAKGKKGGGKGKGMQCCNCKGYGHKSSECPNYLSTSTMQMEASSGEVMPSAWHGILRLSNALLFVHTGVLLVFRCWRSGAFGVH